MPRSRAARTLVLTLILAIAPLSQVAPAIGITRAAGPAVAGDPADQPPAAPTGLTATPGNHSVALSWTANTEPDLAGYNVYRDRPLWGPTVQIAAAGDIASCTSTGDEATAALLATISGDVLALGDSVYVSGSPDEYANCYEPTWGVYKARTRPAVGNHEYGTENASGYFDYFGAAAGTPGQGWYSYDYGTWHVIVLNSMCAEVGGCGPGSPQLAWLQADLAAHQASCTMAVWHHARFSSASNHGSDPITYYLYQALYDANADLVLSGHDHAYERFAPQSPMGTLDTARGIREFVVGTGGGGHSGLGTLRANSEIFNGDTYGVLKLQLKPTGYDWEFVPEAGKTFTDRGSDLCHDANGPIAAVGPLNGGTLLTSPSFTDTAAFNGRTYSYTVTAVDAAGQESAASAAVPATPDGGPDNTAPVIDTVTVSPSSPTTDQTLTATVTSHDAEGGPLTTSYQWTRNGTDIGGATAATLNLAPAGNGDKGDLIAVRATVSDGSLASAPATSSAVSVANTPPSATVALGPPSPGSAATVTATATKSDADSEPISLTFVWKVNGVTMRTFTSSSGLVDTFDLSLAGNGDPGDVVSVELTPNDGTVAGTTVAAQVTVAAAGPTTYASDAFNRTVVDSWGKATVGGAWSLSGSAADFDVNGAAGTIALAAARAYRAAFLNSVSAADVDLSVRVTTSKTPGGGNQYIYAALRRVSSANFYRATLRIATSGQVYVGASSVINNTETGIGSEVRVPGLTYVPGAFIWLRAQVSGFNPTTIRVRAWADGTTEPSTWQYTASNSIAALQAAGGLGLEAYLSSATTNAPVLVSFDDYAVASFP
jgi:hypothetical protein